jgi:oligoribonuclease (3'-5' exoribonuclease)
VQENSWREWVDKEMQVRLCIFEKIRQQINLRESHLTLEDGDEILSEFIKKHCPKAPLAGNSVHADRQFMCKELPKSVKELHYRIIDVSSIKELAKRWYPGLKERNKDRKVSSKF